MNVPARPLDPAPRSRELFARAQRVLVGGVSSPVRSFGAVGGAPRFVRKARGAHLEDADGRTYVDFCMSWGALILGHAHPAVVRAVQEAAARGTSYGAATELEVELGERVKADFPSVERLRFVNSGTEATMSAVRTARGFTGRSKIVVFEGGYHGHSDALLVRAGSGLAAAGQPRSAGVTAGAARDTLVVPYNGSEAARRLFAKRGRDIAAVLVEPVAANMGVVPPQPGFLEALRELCERAGALLVFDEVVTGWRVGPSGAQGRFGVRPDLTCLGKVMGGGLPAAAFGGREDVMDKVAPLGPVYQAGTLSGNPLAMAAGLAALDALDAAAYERLERSGALLERALQRAASEAGVPAVVTRVASMVGLFLSEGPVTNFADAARSNRAAYARLFHEALGGGVYLPPSPLEALFTSLAHDRATLDFASEALAQAFAAARRPGP